MVLDLVIIHSQDTVQWTEYILGYLDKEVFNKKTCIKLDTELARRLDDAGTQMDISSAKALIVIVSPRHLQFLIECVRFTYARFVNDARRAQLFLCGTVMSDFEAADVSGRPISCRFPAFHNWTILSHENNVQLLTKAMILMEADDLSAPPGKHKSSSSNGTRRRRKKEFETTPHKVSCEELKIITILLNESIGESEEDVHVRIVFCGVNPAAPVSIDASWRNPYTVQFRAPEQPPGTYSFTMMANGAKIGSSQLLYQASGAAAADHFTGAVDLVQVYIHQMSLLCRYISDVGLPIPEVDSLLSKILDESYDHTIPPQVFERLFGVFASTYKNFPYEFPTLLHLAAEFGLHEFCTKLIDLPDAQVACVIRNSAERTPEDLAIKNGHTELARLLQDFKVVNEAVSNVYDFLFPDCRRSLTSESSDLSRTPTADSSSSGSENTYLEMTPNLATDKQSTTDFNSVQLDSDDEDGDYVKPDSEIEEAKQKFIQRQQQEQQTTGRQFLQPRNVSITKDKVETESTKPAVPIRQNTRENALGLVDILNHANQSKISVAETEHLLRGWQSKSHDNHRGSFIEKKSHLAKLREEVAAAKDSFKHWNVSRNVSESQPAPFPPADPYKPLSTFSNQQPKIEYKIRKSKKPEMKLPEVSGNPLESTAETGQRNSNASASSRESLLSVTSRTSTSSGVEIDTEHEEQQVEQQSLFRSFQHGKFDAGTRQMLNKRKSRNLEMLEEELTCSEARTPPPLPPRMNSGRKQEYCPSPLPNKLPPVLTSAHQSQKTVSGYSVGSVALPPIPKAKVPEKTVKRSRSEGRLLDVREKLSSSSKSNEQSPPLSPRVRRNETFHSTSYNRADSDSCPRQQHEGIKANDLTAGFQSHGKPQDEATRPRSAQNRSRGRTKTGAEAGEGVRPESPEPSPSCSAKESFTDAQLEADMSFFGNTYSSSKVKLDTTKTKEFTIEFQTKSGWHPKLYPVSVDIHIDPLEADDTTYFGTTNASQLPQHSSPVTRKAEDPSHQLLQCPNRSNLASSNTSSHLKSTVDDAAASKIYTEFDKIVNKSISNEQKSERFHSTMDSAACSTRTAAEEIFCERAEMAGITINEATELFMTELQAFLDDMTEQTSGNTASLESEKKSERQPTLIYDFPANRGDKSAADDLQLAPKTTSAAADSNILNQSPIEKQCKHQGDFPVDMQRIPVSSVKSRPLPPDKPKKSEPKQLEPLALSDLGHSTPHLYVKCKNSSARKFSELKSAATVSEVHTTSPKPKSPPPTPRKPSKSDRKGDAN